MKPQDLALGTAGFIISALLAGNMYFISRLIDKVDKIEETTWGLKQEVLVLKISFESRKH